MNNVIISQPRKYTEVIEGKRAYSNRIIKITFPFDFKEIDKIKTLSERTYVPEGKYWTCPFNITNIKQLQEWGYQLSPELLSVVTLNNEISTDKKPLEYVEIKGLKGKLFDFQNIGVSFIESKGGRALVADEMGCIDGNAIISVSRCKKTFKVKLKDAYKRFNQIAERTNHNWDNQTPTFVRCLKSNNIFGLNGCRKILYKGVQSVIKIKTESGKVLNLTPDHLLLSEKYKWVEASKFKIGDSIIINGMERTICPICRSHINIIKSETAKYKGYCKDCMYKLKRNNNIRKNHSIGSDGYIYISGAYFHPFTSKHYSVTEHRMVLEADLNKVTLEKWLEIIHTDPKVKQKYKFISMDWEVHHINEIRNDNRLENLQIISISDHKKVHNANEHFQDFYHHKGNLVVTIPKVDKIISIKENGKKEVYDIVMKNPDRNFIANGIVVHNCGKTIQAIGWLQLHPELRPAIIVVPASVKLNWANELIKWMPKPFCEVLYGTTPYRTTGQILILNYDIISKWIPELRRNHPQVLVLDEIHSIKNSGAKRTKAVKLLAKGIPCVIGLSGTPIVNRPIEIYNALTIINSSVIPNFKQYTQRFCNPKYNGFGWDYSGATNTEELHQILVNTFMIRRKKSEVLKDLPDKMKAFIPMELSNQEVYNSAEKDFITFLRATKGVSAAERASNAETLVEIEGLKQIAIQGKIVQCIEWIRDFLESDNKLVVFAVHKTAIDQLMKAFPDISVKVDGSVSIQERQTNVDTFQNDPNIRLFIGNIQAAGQGITLTAASNVAFIELPWTPGSVSQASDRVHRIGQKDAVTIHYLLAANTIEEKIAKLLDSKQIVLDSVLDGEKTEEKGLLTELIKSYINH